MRKSGDDERTRSALKSYKHVSPDLSYLEELYLNSFWDAVASTYPTWLAPNLLTFGGCIFSTLALAVVRIYPCERGPLCLLVAFFLFCYQTCDGTDGKQARNTGAGSPIGELIDHGVDALVTSWYVAIILSMSSYEFSDWGFYILLASQVAFVTSQMTLLHIGTQKIGRFETQESQVVVQLMCVLNSFGLRELVWDHYMELPVPFIGGGQWCWSQAFAFSIVCMTAATVASTTYDIMQFHAKRKADGAEEDEHESLSSLGYQLSQLALFALLSLACYWGLPVWQWFFLSSFVIADISNHVLVSRITKVATPWFNDGLLVMAVAAIVGDRVVSGWIFVGAAAALQLYFFWSRLTHYATLLDVNILTIKQKN